MVGHFSFLLLATGSPLLKSWQFWPFQSPPDHTKCYLTAKSSPQPSIHIFRKSKKKLATFPIDFFRGIAKVWEGGHFTPPPASDRVNQNCAWDHKNQNDCAGARQCEELRPVLLAPSQVCPRGATALCPALQVSPSLSIMSKSASSKDIGALSNWGSTLTNNYSDLELLRLVFNSSLEPSWPTWRRRKKERLGLMVSSAIDNLQPHWISLKMCRTEKVEL